MQADKLLKMMRKLLAEGHQQPLSDDQAEGSMSSINALKSAFQQRSLLYGIAPITQVLRLPRRHIFQRQGELLLETHRVQEAQTDLRKRLQRARSGRSQLVGGFQIGGEPVSVISVALLVEFIANGLRMLKA